jgi:hypothetical protein
MAKSSVKEKKIMIELAQKRGVEMRRDINGLHDEKCWLLDVNQNKIPPEIAEAMAGLAYTSELSTDHSIGSTSIRSRPGETAEALLGRESESTGTLRSIKDSMMAIIGDDSRGNRKSGLTRKSKKDGKMSGFGLPGLQLGLKNKYGEDAPAEGDAKSAGSRHSLTSIPRSRSSSASIADNTLDDTWEYRRPSTAPEFDVEVQEFRRRAVGSLPTLQEEEFVTSSFSGGGVPLSTDPIGHAVGQFRPWTEPSSSDAKALKAIEIRNAPITMMQSNMNGYLKKNMSLNLRQETMEYRISKCLGSRVKSFEEALVDRYKYHLHAPPKGLEGTLAAAAAAASSSKDMIEVVHREMTAAWAGRLGALGRMIINKKGKFPWSEFAAMEKKGIAAEELSRVAKFFQTSFYFLKTLCHLFDTLNVLSTEGEIDPIIQKVIQSGAKLTQCDRMSFWIAERADDGKLWTRFPRTDGGYGLVSVTLNKTAGLVGACLVENRPLLIPDAYSDKRFFRGVDKKNKYRTNAMLCIPIIRAGNIVAVVQAINPMSVDSSQFGITELFLAYVLGHHADACCDETRRISKAEWYNKRRLSILQAAEDTLNRFKKLTFYASQTGKKNFHIDGRGQLVGRALELMQSFFPHSREPRLYIVFRDFVLRMKVDGNYELKASEAPDNVGQVGKCLEQGEAIIGNEKELDSNVDITPPLGGCVYTCPIFSKSIHGRRRNNIAAILQWSMVQRDVSMSELDDGSHFLQNDPHHLQEPAMDMLKRTIGSWIEKHWHAMSRYSMSSMMRRKILAWSRHADETTIFYAVTKLQSLYRKAKAANFVQSTFGWHVMKSAQQSVFTKKMEKRMKQERMVKKLAAADRTHHTDDPRRDAITDGEAPQLDEPDFHFVSATQHARMASRMSQSGRRRSSMPAH